MGAVEETAVSAGVAGRAVSDGEGAGAFRAAGVACSAESCRRVHHKTSEPDQRKLRSTRVETIYRSGRYRGRIPAAVRHRHQPSTVENYCCQGTTHRSWDRDRRPVRYPRPGTASPEATDPTPLLGIRPATSAITYKAEMSGVPVAVVDPRNTSRTCSQCGYCDKANRVSQATFRCRHCQWTGHADHNAACNIAALGHRTYRAAQSTAPIAATPPTASGNVSSKPGPSGPSS